MAAIHRHDDFRTCQATTVVGGQSTVFANGKLVSVEDDPNSHGGGSLNATNPKTVFVERKNIIINGDDADADTLCPPLGGAHCDPDANSGSPDVYVY